jgi:integrase
MIAVSPAAGVKAPSSESSRDRVLTDDEVRLLWQACGQVDYPFGPLAKLLLLTGARRDEATGLLRSALSADGAIWMLPPTRTKNSQPHAIPLSPQARAVIAAAPIVALSKTDIADGVPRHGKHRDLVFTTTGRAPVSGYARAKERLDEAMLAIARKDATERGDDPADVKIAAWTFHDLRRTVASGMARLGVDLPVIERCLNHVSGVIRWDRGSLSATQLRR